MIVENILFFKLRNVRRRYGQKIGGLRANPEVGKPIGERHPQGAGEGALGDATGQVLPGAINTPTSAALPSINQANRSRNGVSILRWKHVALKTMIYCPRPRETMSLLKRDHKKQMIRQPVEVSAGWDRVFTFRKTSPKI